MTSLTWFDWIEAIGWFASALTVASYLMNTMLLLRILAVASSVAFIAYGLLLGLWPLIAMEALLLPINLYRFWEILSLRGKVKATAQTAAPDFSVIKSYGRPRRIAAGTTVFSRGDAVDQLYYLAEGEVEIEDLGITLAAGDIFGEIAFFTEASTRTATARSTGESLLYEIDEKRFMRLQFEDPSFGLAVMRTVTKRLMDNLNRMPPTPQTKR